MDFRSAVPIPGLGAGVHGYDEPEQQIKMVDHLVRQLRKRGFDDSSIVILTCKGLDASVLSQQDSIAGSQLCKYTGQFDAAMQPKFTQGTLRFESVRRFKGEQSPAVILVDVSPTDKRVERGSPVVFCGMTRATVRLEMVVDAGNKNCHRYFEAQS